MLNTTINLLNRFRGIEVRESTEEHDVFLINFLASCPTTLKSILYLELDCNFTVTTFMHEKLSEMVYSLEIDKISIKDLIQQLTNILHKHPKLNEQLLESLLEKRLNEKSTLKYHKFIKYLRRNLKGADQYSAYELLQANRMCPDCGDYLYSEADEAQAILEFSSPRKAMKVMTRLAERHYINE